MAMLTYKGGNSVGKGTYWELANGQRIDVANEAVLMGDGNANYLRMPTVVMLIVGPVIGLLYAILMPLIGMVTVAGLALRAIVGGLYNLAARSISFGWRPSSAYLTGKKKKEGKK
jgi:hypothetical protein